MWAKGGYHQILGTRISVLRLSSVCHAQATHPGFWNGLDWTALVEYKYPQMAKLKDQPFCPFCFCAFLFFFKSSSFFLIDFSDFFTLKKFNLFWFLWFLLLIFSYFFVHLKKMVDIFWILSDFIGKKQHNKLPSCPKASAKVGPHIEPNLLLCSQIFYTYCPAIQYKTKGFPSVRPSFFPSRSCNTPWILKRGGLESSGWWLISSIGKTKRIAFLFLFLSGTFFFLKIFRLQKKKKSSDF